MRLLVATYRLPLGNYTADRNTVFNTIKYFSRRHHVSLVSFTESREEELHNGKLRAVCSSVDTVPRRTLRSLCGAAINLVSSEPSQVAYYGDPAMQQLISVVIQREKIDLVYVYHLRMGQYFAHMHSIPRCIALQPAQTLHLERLRHAAPSLFKRLIYQVEYRKMKRYEPWLASQFDRWLVISEKDRAAIDPPHRLTNYLMSPHGVDPTVFCPDPSVPKEPGSIVFASSIRGEANIDAALYFCREIYPRIQARLQGAAKLYIVGAGPPASVQALAHAPTIRVTGYVPEIVPFLRRGMVGIDPLRSGAGLQNKILEGMAVGLPMVVTSVANEGIGAVPGREIIVADTPEEFAEEVCGLLLNPARRTVLARGARCFIERSFTWEKHLEPLEDLFETLVRSRANAILAANIVARGRGLATADSP